MKIPIFRCSEYLDLKLASQQSCAKMLQVRFGLAFNQIV